MGTQKKNWQQRRAEHLKAAVMDVLHRPAGETENKAIPRVAAQRNGRNLPGRKHLKLSAATLRRIWYLWKKDPSDAVFNLHSAGADNQSVIQPWVLHLFTAYAVQRGIGIHQAYRELHAADPGLPFSLRTLQRHLPAADRARIAEAMKLHKNRIKIEQQIKTVTTGGTR